jgi:hypothetical protein
VVVTALVELVLGYVFNVTIWRLHSTVFFFILAVPPLAFIIAPWFTMWGLIRSDPRFLKAAVELHLQSLVAWLLGAIISASDTITDNQLGYSIGVGLPLLWVTSKLLLIKFINIYIGWMENVDDRWKEWFNVHYPLIKQCLQDVLDGMPVPSHKDSSISI